MCSLEVLAAEEPELAGILLRVVLATDASCVGAVVAVE